MRKKRSCFVTILLLFICINFNLSAQFHDSKKGGGVPDKQLSQKDNDYLDRQAKVFLDSVQSILFKYPPTINEHRERDFAKLLMDAVFHEHYAAFRKPTQEFFQARIDNLIKELENTEVKEGARIWKLYNMGFIVRTESVTLAFDFASGITSGSEDFAMGTEQIDRIVKQCDALFITHRHEDHGEKRIAERFIESGLPVFAPKQIWKNDEIQKNIINPERVIEKHQHFKVNGKNLDIIVYPGHQMEGIDCNVYLIKTPEGITVSHLGDQINENGFMIDYEWIDKVKENHQVDIMMPSGWTMDIFRIVKGFDPELVLPSHELELGHTVWDRLPFWGDDAYLELTYADLKASDYSVVVMLWGESFHYSKK
ncbi:MAG: MBL fold metallo-hydrolase [Bacteroidetes bacterium]|nr:MBL fold metallo-hydrolase [Bacteroidota bacterium]